MSSAKRLAASEEAQRLLEMYGGASGLPACLTLISSQFAVIQTRSQLLLTLSTLTLTITGFSGPKIAESGAFERGAMVVGIALVLASTVAILLGGLRVQWVTQISGPSPQETLTSILEYRNNKTALYRFEMLLIVLGLSSYVSSVIAYLLHW